MDAKMGDIMVDSKMGGMHAKIMALWWTLKHVG